MSKSLPFNPYHAPSEVPFDAAGERSRPGPLIAICILAIMLGSLGMLTGTLQGVGLLAGKQFQKAFQPPIQKGQEELARIQRDMQDQMDGIAGQYFVPNIILLLTHFTVAGLLFLGGILALAKLRAGRTMLLAVCLLGVCYEVGRTAISIVISLQTMPVMESFMEQTVSASPPGANRPRQETVNAAAKAGMKIGMVMSFAFVGFFALVKVTFYIISLAYLARARVKAVFETTPGSGQLSPGRA